MGKRGETEGLFGAWDFAGEIDGSALYHFLFAAWNNVDAAAQKGVQPHFGEETADCLVGRAVVFALLGAEIDKVCVHSAAFQKADLFQQGQGFGGVYVAADYGIVSRDAISPKL